MSAASTGPGLEPQRCLIGGWDGVLHHSCSMQRLLSALLPHPLTLFVCALLVGLTLLCVRRPRESYRAADFGANLPEEKDEISFDEPSPTGKSGGCATVQGGHAMPASCCRGTLGC